MSVPDLLVILLAKELLLLAAVTGQKLCLVFLSLVSAGYTRSRARRDAANRRMDHTAGVSARCGRMVISVPEPLNRSIHAMASVFCGYVTARGAFSSANIILY